MIRRFAALRRALEKGDPEESGDSARLEYELGEIILVRERDVWKVRDF